MIRFVHRGVGAALGAALLFGVGTPLAKVLLGHASPWLLAALLYLGSGIGLLAWRIAAHAKRPPFSVREIGWLLGAIVTGGMMGPVLLMWGLSNMPASGASLLLNAEGVFTALIAWFVFRENFDRRIALGMALIVAGALVLSWPGDARFGAALPAISIVAACLAWAIDNNLTRMVSHADATFIAMVKGLSAGIVNATLSMVGGSALPVATTLLAAGIVGFLSYGLSLMLFVIALRDLGTARTGAYFSTAPFTGAIIALLLLAEPITVQLALAGALMATGVWLHLTEHHEHPHAHAVLDHTHEHEHDAHHQHDHPYRVAPGTRHTHEHHHDALPHTHPHYPDAHHRHEHD
jgi:drug/metabolite transporter (DMT)-like permease